MLSVKFKKNKIGRLQKLLNTNVSGANLYRAFGFADPQESDPFLMLDDFKNNNPEDYKSGFPWHPHRGIETITYVLEGCVEHKDSLGNEGNLLGGDVQWMTAGSGIMHQEMPSGNTQGLMHGFQLWANLPSCQKLVKPRYQDIEAKDITFLEDDDGSKIKVIVGNYHEREVQLMELHVNHNILISTFHLIFTNISKLRPIRTLLLTYLKDQETLIMHQIQ